MFEIGSGGWLVEVEGGGGVERGCGGVDGRRLWGTGGDGGGGGGDEGSGLVEVLEFEIEMENEKEKEGERSF